MNPGHLAQSWSWWGVVGEMLDGPIQRKDKYYAVHLELHHVLNKNSSWMSIFHPQFFLSHRSFIVWGFWNEHGEQHNSDTRTHRLVLPRPGQSKKGRHAVYIESGQGWLIVNLFGPGWPLDQLGLTPCCNRFLPSWFHYFHAITFYYNYYIAL